MNDYILELDWSTDFSVHLDFFKKWSIEQQGWHDHYNDYGSWVIIRPLVLEGLEHFKNLNSKFKENGFIIHDGVFRSIPPKRVIAVHTDSVMSPEGTNDLCTLSLNIPLENQQSATTRWYDFSNCNYFKNHETREGVKDSDSIFSNVIANRMFALLLSCQVFSFKMSKPVAINTGIPHNVDTGLANHQRSIVSLHLKDLNTNKILSWDDRHRLLNITF